MVMLRIPYPLGLLCQGLRRAHRRSERRLEGPRTVEHERRSHAVADGGRQGQQAARRAHPAAAGSARALKLVTGRRDRFPPGRRGGRKLVPRNHRGGHEKNWYWRRRLRHVAGGAWAQSQVAGGQLEKCSETLGTLAVIEDRNANWYHTMQQYKVQSTVPLLRMLIQQSNCFVVVERGARDELDEAGAQPRPLGRDARGQQFRQGPDGRRRLRDEPEHHLQRTRHRRHAAAR